MPVYDFECENGHLFEVRCSIANRTDEHRCDVEDCDALGRQVLLQAPMLNDPNVRILDYPGSKKFKAGYVHSHGDRAVSKVSVGAGGALNPSTKAVDPLVQHVRPDPVRFRKKTVL